MSPGNPSGTFLIRVSSTQKNALSLSLRDGEGIKHYRIRRLDDGGFYIASRVTFKALNVCWCEGGEGVERGEGERRWGREKGLVDIGMLCGRIITSYMLVGE